MVPKKIAYVKNYNGLTKWMCFLIEHGNDYLNVFSSSNYSDDSDKD